MRTKESAQLKYSRILLLGVSVAALAATALLNGGCTPNGSSPEAPTASGRFTLIQDVSPIFSTRPSVNTHAFFLVKMQRPPLMTSLTVSGGKSIVDPDSLKAITDEQNELIAKLQALSSDIRIVYRYRMVLNGFAIVAPTALQDKIAALGGVSHLEAAGSFEVASFECCADGIELLSVLNGNIRCPFMVFLDQLD